jgi:hypothetical protein
MLLKSHATLPLKLFGEIDFQFLHLSHLNSKVDHATCVIFLAVCVGGPAFLPW